MRHKYKNDREYSSLTAERLILQCPFSELPEKGCPPGENHYYRFDLDSGRFYLASSIGSSPSWDVQLFNLIVKRGRDAIDRTVSRPLYMR